MQKIATHCLALSYQSQVDFNLKIVDDCDQAESRVETRLKEVIPSHFKASKFNFFQPW